MTLTNAIKKAEKITGQTPSIEGQFYIFYYKGHTISFAQNGRYDEATNFYTKRIGAKDELISDYFAGTFHENLSQAFKFLNNYNPQL